MFLKIVVIIIFLYLLYRLLGGKKIGIPTFKQFKYSENKEDIKELEENTLVECSGCGVYITKKEAKFKNKNYYCSECTKEK